MKKLIKNANQGEIIVKAFKAFIIRGVGYLFGFLFIWLIARNLGAGEQGVFAIAFLFLSVGSMIAKLGFSTSLVKWIAGEEEINTRITIIKKSFIIVCVSSVVIAMIIYLLAPLIAEWYKKPDVVLSIRVAAYTIPIFSLIDVGSSVFKGMRETTTFSTYFDLLKFVFPAVVFLFLYTFFEEYEAIPIKAYFFGHFLLLIILMAHLQFKFKFISGKKVAITFLPIKKMLDESYPMMIASSIVMIMGWSDIFILGFFVSEEKIGVYNTAVKIATVVSFTYTAIATITTPKIAEYYSKGDRKKLLDTIQFSSKAMFLCALPIFLILYASSEYVLMFFGSEYIEGITVLRILLFAQFTNVATGPVGPIFQMTGQQKRLQYLIILSLILNIGLSIILVPFYDMEGVAMGSALGMILWNMLGAIYLKKELSIRSWMKFRRPYER